MSITVATHSGPFHADDVLAWALVRVFHAPDAVLVRTRDEAQLAQADIVFDVGGTYDPATRRFDHHQQEYQGPLSSAGMVLSWLEESGQVAPALAATLRAQVVDYVDAVDNGRRVPDPGVPCFPNIVHAYNNPAEDMAEFDAAFRRAGELAVHMVEGITAGYRERQESAAVVRAAMQAAAARGSNVVELDTYRNWKDTYFESGGAEHLTEFVVHPGVDGRPGRGAGGGHRHPRRRVLPQEPLYCGLPDARGPAACHAGGGAADGPAAPHLRRQGTRSPAM